MLNKAVIDAIYRKPDYILPLVTAKALASNDNFIHPTDRANKKVYRVIKAHKSVLRKELITQTGLSKALVDRCIRSLVIKDKIIKQQVKGVTFGQTMLTVKD